MNRTACSVCHQLWFCLSIFKDRNSSYQLDALKEALIHRPEDSWSSAEICFALIFYGVYYCGSYWSNIMLQWKAMQKQVICCVTQEKLCARQKIVLIFYLSDSNSAICHLNQIFIYKDVINKDVSEGCTRDQQGSKVTHQAHRVY